MTHYRKIIEVRYKWLKMMRIEMKKSMMYGLFHACLEQLDKENCSLTSSVFFEKEF
jgi:hypothetical protein